MANSAHNYIWVWNYGQKLIVGEVIVWCNPDLIKSDRIANYNARKLQRKKREKMEEKKKKNVKADKEVVKPNSEQDGYSSDVSTGSF